MHHQVLTAIVSDFTEIIPSSHSVFGSISKEFHHVLRDKIRLVLRVPDFTENISPSHSI